MIIDLCSITAATLDTTIWTIWVNIIQNFSGWPHKEIGRQVVNM